VLVVTGPSGVGKGTLIRALVERRPELRVSVSATTRAPRAGERDGVDYHFLAPEEFEERERRGEFLETATYAGNRYGTPSSELERAETGGGGLVLEIELDGARQVRRALPEAVQVFLAPPSLAALRDRLEGRASDLPATIADRLDVAEREMAAQNEFAHVIVNDRLEATIDELEALVTRAWEGGPPARVPPSPSEEPQP
jgi:guanylate kinase